MPRKDQIDRMIVMFYLSLSRHDFINFTRPAEWLDVLPMAGLEKLRAEFERMGAEVAVEIEDRKADGMPRYSRIWHNELEAERVEGAALLAEIGVHVGEARDGAT